MAQIDLKNIEKIIKERNTLHDKVYTTYSTFEMYGDKYVQIDTYGKSSRDLPGKISQSIQLDRDSAEFLVMLLKNEFEI